MKALIGLRAF